MSETIKHPNPLGEALVKFKRNDPDFRLHKAANLLHAQIEINEGQWVSKTRRETDAQSVITIGVQSIPSEVAQRWGLENTDNDEQLLFKISHELAHQFQHEKGYEAALTAWLDGENLIDSKHVPYIELYAAISESGPITGLSTEMVYQAQSANTGRLNMQILEDITELISAYLLGDEYFNHKLSMSLSNLTQEQAEHIATKVIQICTDLH